MRTMRAQTQQGRATAQTLDTLRRYYGFSDREVAERAGYTSRQQVEQRRTGTTAISVDDLEKLARAFGVPASVLLLDAGDAIRWVLDHDPAPGWYAARDSNPEPAD